MNLFTWLKTKFGGGSIPLSGGGWSEISSDELGLYGDLYVREMAFWGAVNVVANAISKCEFKTFVGGEEKKEREYYLWNVEPNKNQSSTAFLQKLIAQLYRTNECLVVESGGQLLVADDYSVKEYALLENEYAKVKVGDFTFDRTFLQSEVLHFRLFAQDMRSVVSGLYDSYSKLINYSMTAYQRSRGTKGVFQYDSIPVVGTTERDAFDSLVNEKISKWLSSDNAALPLGRGQDWKELQHKTYSNETSRDIRAMIDDVSDFTAKAFGIPPALLRGDVQGVADALENFLTFCIDPLAEQLAEEINRKRIGYDGFRQGTYVQIDTSRIKHIDLLSASVGIERLVRSGAFSINDVRRLVGELPVDDEYADEHVVSRGLSAAAEKEETE